jgi:hypothetical protein
MEYKIWWDYIPRVKTAPSLKRKVMKPLNENG